MDEKKNLEEVKKNDIKTSENKNQNKGNFCGNDKTKYWLLGIIGFLVLIIIAGGLCGAFFLNQPKSRQIRGPQEMGKMGRNQMYEGRDKRGMGRMNQKKNVVEGKVTAVNDKVFTIEQDGQSKNIQISDSTRFPTDSANKVAVGDTVIISGEQDSNGTIQATRIIVNPSDDK